MKFSHRIFLLLQEAYILVSSLSSPSIIHNVEKHKILKKFLFYKKIEGLEGDYLEFGVYEGTSIKAAATYWKKIGTSPMKFYGFDSFQGMKPEKNDEHPFYTSFDFSTDYKIIKKRFSKLREVVLVPGFFQKSLSKKPSDYGIKKAAIVMIDCDLYSSSKYAFNFLRNLIQEGTILVIDDYFGYKGNKNKGVRKALDDFVRDRKIECEKITTYGIGGAVFIVSKIKNNLEQ